MFHAPTAQLWFRTTPGGYPMLTAERCSMCDGSPTWPLNGQHRPDSDHCTSTRATTDVHDPPTIITSSRRIVHVDNRTTMSTIRGGQGCLAGCSSAQPEHTGQRGTHRARVESTLLCGADRVPSRRSAGRRFDDHPTCGLGRYRRTVP